jgi:spore coat polysaccharide biosynthesis protein SpsF
MDAEITSFDTLKEAHFNAYDPFDREHVTPFIKMRPQQFRLYNILYKADMSRYRWTVDTPADLELITKIYDALYYKNPLFSLNDILDLMNSNPQLENINAHVKQKK